jgi:MutS domain V
MSTARERYQRLFQESQQKLSQLRDRSRRFEWLRPVVFLPALLLLIAGYTREDGTLAIILGWISFAAFIVIITIHESFRLKMHAAEVHERLYKILLARMDRRWSDLPEVKIAHRLSLDPISDAACQDLDVFGKRSVYTWFCLAATVTGRQTLAKWLTEWAEPKAIVARQDAARELAEQAELREDILWHSSQISDSNARPEDFAEWATSGPWLAKHPVAHKVSILGPLAIVVGLLVWGISRFSAWETGEWAALAIILAGFGANLVLAISQLGKIHDIFAKITSNQGEVIQYQSIYECMERLPHQSELLSDIWNRCCQGDNSARVGFGKLRQLVRLANLQRNPTMFLPYLLLQLLFIWDFRVMERLQRWQSRFGARAADWIVGLGQLEAILSASAIHFEYPSWCIPDVTPPDKVFFDAQSIAHPMLEDAQRVGNDVTISDSRQLLLVTGSNMAGKSTFLRSLGVNLLLARTGSVVCATQMKAQTFEIATSIRVQDSLQDGVSFFMAELLRLREIVKLCQLQHQVHQRPVLVLLDEILQGTNSRERQIAVVEVLEQLRENEAVIAISTHDLDLADRTEIQQHGQVVHFREFFESENGQEKMKFDYRMRPGPTPTTNALKLLEIVGLRKKS